MTRRQALLAPLLALIPSRRRAVPDDAQKTMAVLQLMMGRQISQTTGLKALGLDFEEQQEAMRREEEFVARCQQHFEGAIAAERVVPCRVITPG